MRAQPLLWPRKLLLPWLSCTENTINKAINDKQTRAHHSAIWSALSACEGDEGVAAVVVVAVVVVVVCAVDVVCVVVVVAAVSEAVLVCVVACGKLKCACAAEAEVCLSST